MLRTDDIQSVTSPEPYAHQIEDLHVAHCHAATTHFLLGRQGRTLCVCALFGEDFVLLAGAGGAIWCDAALRAANRLGIRLVARRIGAGGDFVDLEGRWPSACGIGSAGTVLVDPDGLICWRAEAGAEHPEQLLEAVLATYSTAW